jgi:hypothetical protein
MAAIAPADGCRAAGRERRRNLADFRALAAAARRCAAAFGGQTTTGGRNALA